MKRQFQVWGYCLTGLNVWKSWATKLPINDYLTFLTYRWLSKPILQVSRLPSMRSSMLKWILLCATVLISLIIIVQLYWLNKVYSFEQNQFNINVMKSIRGVFEDLQMNDNPAMNLQQLINKPGQDYFLFKAEPFHKKIPLPLLQHEFRILIFSPMWKSGLLMPKRKNIYRLLSTHSTAGSQPVTACLILPILTTSSCISQTGINIFWAKWTFGSSVQS